jgi:prevent-host-death family protein
MKYQTITVKETRDNLSEIIDQAYIGKKSFLITKFGKPKAMILPVRPVKKAKKINKKDKEGIFKSVFGIWKDRWPTDKSSVEIVEELRQKAYKSRTTIDE